MWVYIRTDQSLWTVGFFDPQGTWHSDEDFSNRDDARVRVNFLNGGGLSGREFFAS